jgi:hypothetical protein
MPCTTWEHARLDGCAKMTASAKTVEQELIALSAVNHRLRADNHKLRLILLTYAEHRERAERTIANVKAVLTDARCQEQNCERLRSVLNQGA